MAAPSIKPGELTSEYKVAKKNSTVGIIFAVAGGILATVPEIIQQLQAVDGIQQSRPGMIVITILGGLLMLAGMAMKALAGLKYIEGRSLLKAAAARDVPPPQEV